MKSTKARSLLPKTDEEKRAYDMANAMDWLQSNNVGEDADLDMDSTAFELNKMETFKVADAEKNAMKLDKALGWLLDKDPADLENMEDDDLQALGLMDDNRESAEERRP